MPEVIFPGPEGRLEGRYHPQKDRDAPIAIILHPHPQFGGTMNNKVVYNLHYAFFNMGFTVLRFNFRGVGRSQGEYDQGVGELSDAASALDYLQSMNNNSKHCWVAGFSFGAWIGFQTLMRRPEVDGLILIAPPVNMYDFNFLSPCPIKTLIIRAEQDEIVKKDNLKEFYETFKKQKNADVSMETISKSNHLFEGKLDPLMNTMTKYIEKNKS